MPLYLKMIFGVRNDEVRKQAKAHSNLGFATATSLVLAIPQSILYCDNLYGALIIIASYFLISYLCLNLKFSNDNRWGFLFVFCLPVYIIDMMLLDATGLSRMETYPLVISQIYTLPLFGILNGFICLTGYNLMITHTTALRDKTMILYRY